jgi:anti-anti-sigma factor
MAFEMTTVSTGVVIEITLSGELDGSSAPSFQQSLEELAASVTERPTHLVLRLRDLVFLASAGVRVLFSIKQRLFPGLIVCIVEPQEQAIDTIQRASAHKDFMILEKYPPTSG